MQVTLRNQRDTNGGQRNTELEVGGGEQLIRWDRVKADSQWNVGVYFNVISAPASLLL